MKILICNERFLFRFGVDRVLLLLTKYFRKMGHHVILMGNNMDEGVIDNFADRVIRIPNAPEYLNINEFTKEWLENNWDNYFIESEKPDVILVAGWPFFNAISFFNKVCKCVVFHDYGAVSSEGLEGGALIIQNKLKNLRKEYIPQSDYIIAISEFIKESQSKLDGGSVPSEAILLGTDHMELNIWPKAELDIKGNNIVQEVQRLKNENKKVLFLLGRWEKGYKNSPVGFKLLRELKKSYPDCVLLILAKEDAVEIPIDLKKNVKTLGFVDDEDLQTLMQMSDIGISPSLWEGFNLPLAEMQAVERPVFVFNKGAHPEVVFHPWYLCETKEEMAQKILLELDGKSGVSDIQKKEYYSKFKANFTWESSARKMLEAFSKLVYKESIIFMDVTNSSHDTANSGVIRVTRQIGANLQRRVNTVFVLWDYSIGKYVFPNKYELEILASYGGPLASQIKYTSPENTRLTIDDVFGEFKDKNLWMLMVEITNEEQGRRIRPYLRERKIKIAHVFHDAIPILYPELCSEVVTSNHGLYMKGLAECDLIISDSEISAKALQDFWNKNNIVKHGEVRCNLLPGELKGIDRNNEIDADPNKQIKILCVSTLEPRKNHKTLLQACQLLMKQHEEFKWELILVGNRYAGNEEIPKMVEKVGNEIGRVRWLGVVSDEQLISLYKECAFTVYPSIVEGFGMPVMESLWNGRPCICYEKESMGELARDGGCVTIDIKDAQAVADAIYKLGTDIEFRQNLQRQAITRYIKLWDDYTITLLSDFEAIRQKTSLLKDIKNVDKNWFEVLYGRKQNITQVLSNTERIGINGILSSYNPECCIYLGEDNETLELIATHTERVFCISNAQQSVVKKEAYNNVTTLEGDSEIIVRILLDELIKANITVDFIFIDAMSEQEKLNRIIAVLSKECMKTPMFIGIYNSFVPEVRSRILSIDWDTIEQLAWMDIDFILGHSIIGENNKLSLVGGMSLIHFNRYIEQDKQIYQSGEKMIDTLRKKIKY